MSILNYYMIGRGMYRVVSLVASYLHAKSKLFLSYRLTESHVLVTEPYFCAPYYL